MAKQNEYEVNTDKSVRQLDNLEKKLSRVDRLFERAQRRGSAFSKMTIAPTLVLNDKLSDHLTRIENRLMNLNRTTIAPSLHIADYATAEISGVAAYLRAITEKRWMINFEAISWGKLFSGSFSDWLKGQNLMTSIKEQLSNSEVFQESGTLAGEQFFQSFLEAIDPEKIAEKFKELELNANVNINGGSDSGPGPKSLLDKTGDFFLDVFKDTISGTISGIITNKATKYLDDRKERKKKLKENSAGQGNIVEKEKKKKSNSEKKDRKNKAEGGNKKDKQKSNDRIDNKNKKTPSTKTEKFSFSKTVDKLKETKEWGEKNLNEFGNFLSKKGENAKKFIKGDSSWKPVPDLTKGIDYKGDKFNPISSLSQNAIKDLPDTKFLSKFIKGNGVGILMDAGSIALADSGKERSKAVGSAILSSVGTGIGSFLGSFVTPVLGTAAGGLLGGNLGSDAGEWLGGKVHDLFYGKESSTVSNITHRRMLSENDKEKILRSIEEKRGGAVDTGVLPTVAPPARVSNIGIPGIGSSTRVPAVPFGFVPTPPTPITPTATMQAQPEVQKQVLDPTIQVNLPVGAVQLTMNQPDLDYNKIASIVGMKISSSVQLAWQNTKLR